jgi:hypothetical protein
MSSPSSPNSSSTPRLEQVILPRSEDLARLGLFICLPGPLLPIAASLLEGSGIAAGVQNTWFEGGPIVRSAGSIRHSLVTHRH